MDPNATLQAIRDLCNTEPDIDDHGVCNDLIEKVEALDEWLSRGGFKPEAWKDAVLWRAADGAEDLGPRVSGHKEPDADGNYPKPWLEYDCHHCGKPGGH